MKNLKQVYFRLNSPYEWGKGMSASLFPRFEKETKDILRKIGLTIIPDKFKLRASSPEGICGKENLYMHPMSFSGVLSEERIKKAKEVIENYNSELFFVTRVDIYELKDYSLDTIKMTEKKQKEINGF